MEISDIPLNLTDKIFQIKFNSDHLIEKIISYFPLSTQERLMINSISGQNDFSNFHSIFSFFLLLSALLIVYQTYLIKDFDSEMCLKAFKNNNWLGISIFIGSILGVSL